MKTIIAFMLSIAFFVFLTFSPKLASSGEFPLSPKGWQATIVKIEGVNTSKALAVGEVRRENAIEYCERNPDGQCERNPDGEIKESGVSTGYLTKEQCVEKVLKEEKGKQYSASADCPRKTITTSWGEAFTIIGKDDYGEYIWRNIRSGKVLDGSNSSGAPVVGAQYKMLCPADNKGQIDKTKGPQKIRQIELGPEGLSEEIIHNILLKHLEQLSMDPEIGIAKINSIENVNNYKKKIDDEDFYIYDFIISYQPMSILFKEKRLENLQVGYVKRGKLWYGVLINKGSLTKIN